MLRRLVSVLRDEGGVVAPITGILIVALVGLGALAVDLGSLQAIKRQLQAATDAAALAGTYAFATNSGTPSPASWVNAYLARNSFPGAEVIGVDAGTYCPESAVPAASRFSPGAASCPGFPSLGTGPNAVRVHTRVQAPLYLGRILAPGAGTAAITATATAAQIPQAGFFAGSGLLSLDQGLVNAVLSGLLGTSINLTAAQYQGLLATNISALSFFKALATNVGVSAGTYDSLLGSSVSISQILQAMVDALDQPGSIATVALNTLQAQVIGNPMLRVGDLFNLGVWQGLAIGSSEPPPALTATLNAYQLATLTAQVANGSHAAAIPAATLGIPGVATLSAASTIIEPPVSAPFVFGPVGMTVHTAQVRLQLQLDLLNVLSLGGLLGTAPVSVPLYLEVAAGDARLTGITCGFNPGTDAQATITARPAGANIYVATVNTGAMTNFSTPVQLNKTPTLVNVLGLVKITGQAEVSVGAGSETQLTFSQADIAAHKARTAISTGMLANLLQTLGQTLKLDVQLLGLPLPIGPLVSGLTALLDPLFSGLDPLVDGLLAALGIRLGYLDVTATGMRCGQAVLVY